MYLKVQLLVLTGCTVLTEAALCLARIHHILHLLALYLTQEPLGTAAHSGQSLTILFIARETRIKIGGAIKCCHCSLLIAALHVSINESCVPSGGPPSQISLELYHAIVVLVRKILVFQTTARRLV